MPQERLGRYLLLDKIGQGGMAEVFAARLDGPQQFVRSCVVKRLRPELAALPHQVQLFIEEARLSAMLVHPCVVQVFDVGEQDGQYFFAMERIEGPSLSRVEEVLWRDRTQIPVDIAAWIAARAAEGLHFAHELVDKQSGKPLHIAHRDVSPHNLLLGMAGDVKVADFGIAKADVEHRPQTRVGITKGKLGYMSPEQARGDRVDRRTDVYALGVVLWEMLVGRPLVYDRSERRKLDMGRVPPPSSMRTDVDPALDDVVVGMLQPQARDRTPSCRDVEEALDHWLLDHTRSAGGARARLQALLRDRQGALVVPQETSDTKPMAPMPAPPPSSPSSSSSPFSRVSANAKTVLRSLPSLDGAPNAEDAPPPPTAEGPATGMVSLPSLAGFSGEHGFADETTRPQIFAAVPNTTPDDSDDGDDGDDGGGAGARLAREAPTQVAIHVVRAGRGAAVPLPDVPRDGPALPTPSTSFVGRKRELDAIALLLDEGARMITLLAPGGTGKTRLALRAAEHAAQARAYPGGVWFADLTGAKDAAAAQSIIARTLGVPLRAGRTPQESQAMLAHALASLGRCLVVLDACDELAGRPLDVIADLLRKATRARFIATSQQLLGVPGEAALAVPPLPFPDHESAGARVPTVGGGGEEGAVELFLERARAARGGHALSDAARGVVVDIVKRLHGVPLAIELAAARAATETPNEILQRLGNDGAGRARGAAAEDAGDARTLKAAIGDTYAQLADDEKRAFRQASVFRGGFTLDAADAVIDVGEADGSSASGALERLKGRSLVVMRGHRFYMLEALRAFATERLEEAGERAPAEARHAGYFVSAGRKLAAALEGGDADAGEKLAAETENLAVVVERVAAAPRASTAQAALALEAALALDPVLSQRSSAAEQLALLEKALALADARGVADAVRLRGHLARGEARRLAGANDAARADLHAAVDLAVALEDEAGEGRALASVGALALSQGKLELAEETLARAFALSDGAGDRRSAGRTLALLGKVSRLRRRLDESEERCRRAAQISRSARDERAVGRALVELATALLAGQKLDDAAHAAQEAARGLARDRRSSVHAWGTLAVIELDRRRYDDAESAAARAVDLAVRVGDRRAEGLYTGIRGSALHGKGALLDARELYTQAVRALFEAGDDGHGGFFAGALGAVNAALDDIDSAGRAFAIAHRRLKTAEKPLLSAAVSIFDALLALAKAGDGGARAHARDGLRALLAGLASSLSLSEELRFAARVGRAALE